jgi:antitoxin PrlF
MIMGRVTAKSQTTIPRAVRIALGIKPGDRVAYEIDGNMVKLRAVPSEQPDNFINNFSCFTEWSDEYDSVYDQL